MRQKVIFYYYYRDNVNTPDFSLNNYEKPLDVFKEPSAILTDL